ncbi:hypothetical protein EAM01S_02_02800 [Erwinia amylovora NBRC 12687 = CFBP 1232]|nr:hypothetical protein EAM01S_02_02800 [Erwinia amylovora NBRC 12687 = CFBP 1232]
MPVAKFAQPVQKSSFDEALAALPLHRLDDRRTGLRGDRRRRREIVISCMSNADRQWGKAF